MVAAGLALTDLVEAIHRTVATPGDAALIHHLDLSISAAEIHRQSDALAADLQKNGLERGDVTTDSLRAGPPSLTNRASRENENSDRRIETAHMTTPTTWQPATIDERLDRLESMAEIRQLADRYGVAVDSRDIDMLVGLFVPDVQVGKDKHGRAALHAHYTNVLRHIGPSLHFVGNHIIDFHDRSHATGIVYCWDELGSPHDDKWDVGVLQYWDEYQRVDRRWYFRRRLLHRLYMVDALERPRVGTGLGRSTMKTHRLPEAYPSWHRFWSQFAADGVPEP